MAVWRVPVVLNSAFITGTGANTWHIRTAAEGDGAAIEAAPLIEAIRVFYASVGENTLSPVRVSFDGILRRVDAEVGTIQEAEGWTFSPPDNGEPLPLAIAMCVSWRTSLATRRGRGRTFLGPVAASTLEDNGTPLASIRAEIVSACADLIGASQDNNLGGIGVWSPADQVLRDFIGATVPNEYAVLRSRRD